MIIRNKIILTCQQLTTLTLFLSCLNFEMVALALSEKKILLKGISADLDCLNSPSVDSGKGQPCIDLKKLAIDYEQEFPGNVSGRFQIDFFGLPATYMRDRPWRELSPSLRDTPLWPVSEFEILWVARPHLTLRLEKYGGAAWIPNMSGLPSAAPYSNTGWDQLAFSVTYDLPYLEKFSVKLVAGNGEGETAQNLDPQQYFAAEINASIIPGVRFHAGASHDGNHVGSQSGNWIRSFYQDQCEIDTSSLASRGYSTDRYSASAGLDGNLPVARGFKASAGWQRIIKKDISKGNKASPDQNELLNCPYYDLDLLFVEDVGDVANTIKQESFSVNASYLILDTYFLGLDYSARNLSTGVVDVFRSCSQVQELECIIPDSPSNTLKSSAWTFGLGVVFDEALRVVFEYHKDTMDKTYEKIFRSASQAELGRSWETFLMRVQYAWK